MKKAALLIWYSLYVICLLSLWVDPAVFPLLVLLSMCIVPLSLLTLPLALLVAWRSKASALKWVSIFFVGLTAFQLTKLVACGGENPVLNDFKVLSFNTSFFRVPTVFSPGYFNPEKPTTYDKMIDWIVEQDADAVLLQEFFNDERSAHFNAIEALMERGGFQDHYFINRPQHDNGVSRGLAIFSKYPILHKRTFFLGENRYNGAQAVLIDLNGQPLELVNVHLKSSALHPVKNTRTKHGIIEGVKRFFNDGVLRTRQVNVVLDSLANSAHPVIVAGDFNSTRLSRVFEMMDDEFEPAFSAAGWGLGFTFQGKLKLPVMIDHQFSRAGANAVQLKVMKEMKYSDHFPLMGYYRLSDGGN
jgi:endonuclease/exonuclease/phosphatase (EEP) superfamily protein YafD